MRRIQKLTMTLKRRRGMGNTANGGATVRSRMMRWMAELTMLTTILTMVKTMSMMKMTILMKEEYIEIL